MVGFNANLPDSGCCPASSVDPFAGASTVDFFECKPSTLVKDAFRLQALILIVSVGCHACSETLDVVGAELAEDILSGGVFVLSSEVDDSLVDEGRLLLGTTEHVDHVFHGHGYCIFLSKEYYYNNAF